MRKSELNQIIREKIMNSDESDEIKGYLLEVLENELKNLYAARGRFSNDYMESADKRSGEEHKHVDIRDKT